MERPEPEFVEEILRRPARASAALSILMVVVMIWSLASDPDNRTKDSLLWNALWAFIICLLVFLTAIATGRRGGSSGAASESPRNDNQRPRLAALGCILTFTSVFGAFYYEQIWDVLRPRTPETPSTPHSSGTPVPPLPVGADSPLGGDQATTRLDPNRQSQRFRPPGVGGPMKLVADISNSLGGSSPPPPPAPPPAPPPSGRTVWARVGKTALPTPSGATFRRDAGLPALEDVRTPQDLDRHKGQMFAAARRVELAACPEGQTPEDLICPPTEASPAGTIGPWVEDSGGIVWVRIDP